MRPIHRRTTRYSRSCIWKERFSRMQQLTSRPQSGVPPTMPPRNISDRSAAVLVTALILFAIAGLLSGFATGAINRAHHTPPNTTSHNTQGNNSTTPSKTGSTTKTPGVSIVPIGCPIPDRYVPIESADGQTPYTISAFATAQSNDIKRSCGGNQLMDAGITFKLWLTQQISYSINFPQGAQSLFNSLNTPITGTAINKSGKSSGEIQDVQGLQFVGTSQVQQSDAHGRVTWKYTLPTSLHAGAYNLFILVDWQGQEYDWSWRNITITKAG